MMSLYQLHGNIELQEQESRGKTTFEFVYTCRVCKKRTTVLVQCLVEHGVAEQVARDKCNRLRTLWKYSQCDQKHSRNLPAACRICIVWTTKLTEHTNGQHNEVVSKDQVAQAKVEIATMN